MARPLTDIPAGDTLRIFDAHPFEVRYTFDDWQTTLTANSLSVGHPGSFADLITPLDEGKLTFTLHWLAGDDCTDHWLGRNAEVALRATVAPVMPAGTKPMS